MKPLMVISALSVGLLAAAPMASALEPRGGVTLRALDKITGDSTDLSVKSGQTVTFGRLKVTARTCYQAPPEDTPESVAFLEIDSTSAAPRSQAAPAEGEQSETRRLFSGWMYASTPGLSALEDPVYDVWVISCTTSAPVSR
ncbi:DUF2155 domain-containing protein [bacterium]|nr:DUF2155 domain-containing protein [bacterium]